MCKDGQVFSPARDGNSFLRSAAHLSPGRSPLGITVPLPLFGHADEVIE